MTIHIYLAAGLFNLGDRMRNALLAKELGKFGYKVILPQREALAFQGEGTFDLAGVRLDCREKSSHPGHIVVACLDGTDADSGTVAELIFAVCHARRAIAYRTDFRTDPVKEVGLNAMLFQPEVSYFYMPCYAVEVEELEIFCRHLATRIHDEVLNVLDG